MVSSRRTRILILTVWAFIVGITFFGYHRSQSVTDTSKFLNSIDETTRLEPELKKESGELAPAAGSKNDLTNDPGEPFSPEKEYKAILSESPVVIFSKSYCPHSKFVKDLLLSEYQITPKPWVVELDMHPHGREFQDYIGQITGRTTVPNVHVKGLSRGGGDEFRELDKSGQLATVMQTWAGSSVRVKKLAPPN
ncbi:hypothetical protein TRVA0_042S00254 [Trichomonascus vanleenenianus]|uniref:glutaredoxin n=1 Tax=Trichomonascus vanleenenianus TaxID=2268995 RepID=UPI003ECA1D0E